jgi:hypothetical protein
MAAHNWHPESGLLSLPDDLLYTTFSELTLPSKVLFSRSCARLRHLFHNSCALALAFISPSERAEYLIGIAQVLPDHYFCIKCERVHTINKMDDPLNPLFLFSCPSGFSVLKYHTITPKLGSGYWLLHHHVQLALKYARRGDTKQKYLRQLMAPHVATRTLTPPMTYFSVQPAIIHGKFLLFRTWTFEQDSVIGGATQLEICPHLNILDINLPSRLLNPLSETLNTANATKGAPVYKACHRCPTDYSVMVLSNHIVFCTWQDFGGERTTSDMAWYIHVKNETNNEFRGPTVPHIEGSLREAFSGQIGQSNASESEKKISKWGASIESNERTEWTKEYKEWSERRKEWSKRSREWSKISIEWHKRHGEWIEKNKACKEWAERCNKWSERCKEWSERCKEWSERCK